MRPLSDKRIHVLSDSNSGDPPSWVLYWMQASVRIDDNQALFYAALQAHNRGLGLLVMFAFVPDYPGASHRHYRFLLDGLEEVAGRLNSMRIGFRIVAGDPVSSALLLSRRAALTVLDCGYTSVQRHWRNEFVSRSVRPVIMVEDNVCLPVLLAYPRSAVGARVLRPGIERLREVFLNDGFHTVPDLPPSPDLQDEVPASPDYDRLLEECPADPGPVPGVRGGSRSAEDRLEAFISGALDRYPDEKNDPVRKAVSGLSPYLHFGQISVRCIARRVIETGSPGAPAFLEELLVRRELAVNFVWYNPDYQNPDILPRWALGSLDRHDSDPRPYVYDESTMEQGLTHDPYWNACQHEMVHTGYMHGYMRMYWGKKVIEWSPSWRRAWKLLLAWNDRYELDGRDPNGYAGVAWCFGMHDRPWGERSVFGVVRYMNDRGLKRKFDVDAYVRDVREQTGEKG